MSLAGAAGLPLGSSWGLSGPFWEGGKELPRAVPAICGSQ